MSRATKRRKKTLERYKQPNAGALFSPGQPLAPQQGVNPEGVPRQWSFPPYHNLSGVDRTLGKQDVPSFQTLRMLSKMYSGITLPERVWLDMIPGLALKIGLTAEMKAQGYDDKDFQKEISTYLKFFEKPDKRLNYHSWLRKAIRSQTQIDELYVYKRRTRGGELYALELVAGDTMKPLLDDWGRIPEPPDPAYQQFPWGLPGEWFSTDDMIHYQETPQDDSPYGFSRVERFILEVNQALRKKRRDLAMFTEGNIPQGIMEVPEASNWSVDDIAKYERMWNSLIAGNTQQQVRLKFTQPGMKYIKLDNGEILTEFDYFLYKISCGVYGISLQDIGFVEDIHKSSDKGQQDMLYRRTLQPIVVMYAKLFFTDVIHDDFDDPRFEASFVGYEEETDMAQMATAYKEFASFGAIDPASVASTMGFPDVPKTGPFIMTKDGPLFLKDYEEGSPLRKMQQDAKVAGMQLAIDNPGAKPGQEEGKDESGKEEKSTDKASAKGQPENSKAGDNPDEESTDTTEEDTAKKQPLQRAAEGNEPANTGIMVAFMLDRFTAELLALPGGEDPGDMHVTLAFMGDSMEQPPEGKLNPATTREVITTVLKSYTQVAAPLFGYTGGIGRFTPSDSSDGMSPVIALVNVPGLQEWRRRLVNVLQDAGYYVASDFDYSPHVTLKYVPDDDPMPVQSMPALPLAFSELCLAIGDDRYFFPIGQESLVNTQEWKGGYVRSESSKNDIDRKQSSEQARKADFRRWRSCALHDVERGRSIRPFESDIIPASERGAIASALERCQSVEGVKAVFKAAQEGRVILV